MSGGESEDWARGLTKAPTMGLTKAATMGQTKVWTKGLAGDRIDRIRGLAVGRIGCGRGRRTRGS
ncbi:hypothetical protein [Streptomyces sp. NPDC048581]|uniref:hypothetical protein n=1 Tax=unclassified Streptomyces TaxID=2593676 RepID=UPI0037196C76